ncbi:MAG: holin family protein [Burkholderiales bacterium]
MFGFGQALEIGLGIIDKIIPDKAQAERMKLEALKLDQEGHFRELDQQMKVLLEEAKSADPWTSRARPGFLYVVYILILAAIPMGIVHALSPAIAGGIAAGFKGWLAAIPDPMWDLFGMGYLGYVAGRSWDKTKLVTGKR